MKNFFKKIFAFLCFTLLIQFLIVSLSYLSTFIPFYFDKSAGEIVFYNSIDSAFFGDSHSEYGFNDEILRESSNINYRNLSLSGNATINNILLLENVLKFNPDMVINLSLGDYNVGKSYFMSGVSTAENFRHWFPYYSTDDIKDIFTVNKKETFQGFLGIVESIKIHSLGYSNAISRINIIQLPPFKKYIVKNYKDLIWFKKLIKIIDKYPKTNFKIIRTPIHIKVFKENKKFLEMVESLTRKPNVRFYDFQEIILDDDDFRDFTHLSSKGAKKLSLEYLKRN